MNLMVSALGVAIVLLQYIARLRDDPEGILLQYNDLRSGWAGMIKNFRVSTLLIYILALIH